MDLMICEIFYKRSTGGAVTREQSETLSMLDKYI